MTIDGATALLLGLQVVTLLIVMLKVGKPDASDARVARLERKVRLILFNGPLRWSGMAHLR